MVDNPADNAKARIAEAFAEINRLPHGTDADAAGLIVAQQHLAHARRALDEWQQEHDPLFSLPTR